VLATSNVRSCCAWATVLLFTLLSVAAIVPYSALAQSESASVSGRVTDQQNAVIPNVEIELRNVDTNSTQTTNTNGDGIYSFPSLRPGNYVMSVRKEQFQTVSVTGITLNVQDNLSRNFTLQVGSSAVSVTVNATDAHINTTDATVSTVIDRQFAENLPMNGRSFQTLIELTPGVVVTPSTSYDGGQFSVNGQRGSSNYWMVDGVGANTGISTSLPGNGFGGAVGSFSVLGGTNSLVSVDALQEFRIQTSTYAPEFGRTPGAQISILTRSGTNQFHGTAFEYLRNDILDASDWFNNSVTPPLPKAKERQNDFGGTFSGPILKDRTFFFFSYEGLRLRLPRTTLTTVPDVLARQNALPTLQPYLNAYPVPNGLDNLSTGIAQFNASYSDPASLDAYSLRVDHKLGNSITLFGRYNYSPSSIVQRGSGGFFSLSTVLPSQITMQTATIGATWAISAALTNDLRFNYSRANASSSDHLDTFGGAVPMASLPFPTPFSPQNAFFEFTINSLQNSRLAVGKNERNLQRQINLIDSLSAQKGSHSLKVGFDFRRLSPQQDPSTYSQNATFGNVSSAENGILRRAQLQSILSPTFLLRNVGFFAQDTWRVIPRLTVTYGLRWDIDFVPDSLSGPQLPGVTGFNLKDLSSLALAPLGTPPYKTTYGNVSPRIGVAYQLFQHRDWLTVLRGGFGIFNDLATSEIGNLIDQTGYPYSALKAVKGTFPLSPAAAAPPTIAPPNAANQGTLNAIDPGLQLPYTLQWNFALEQSVGTQQSISASYVGSTGRRLLQTAIILSPNPNLGAADLVTNAGTSNYNALQLQFQRRLSHGLQALSSYTWSHSIDTASAGSFGNTANSLVAGGSPNANRGPSDFDIRNTFSVGVTYEVPVPKINGFTNAILRGWSLQTFIVARSAPPVDVSDISFSFFDNGSFADIRPDVVPGQSFYVIGAQCAAVLGSVCPGGRGFNPAAFQDPPTSPAGCNPAIDFPCNPARQGNLGRNALRGFGATQWDFAVHRDFPLRESLKLQFRAEMFNVLNHPNFGPPGGSFLSAPNGGPCCGFGVSTQMLGQSLGGGNVGGGGLNPLYQIGGPRSVQFALKLLF
jgi:hypothetical protein